VWQWVKWGGGGFVAVRSVGVGGCEFGFGEGRMPARARKQVACPKTSTGWGERLGCGRKVVPAHPTANSISATGGA